MKKIAVLVGVFILFAVAILPVSAMIGGELDTEHTNVGALVFQWGDPYNVLARACTGTLIHPQVLLTAAHCTVPLIENDLVPDQVWVTFEQDALIGNPETTPEKYLNIQAIENHPNFEVGKEYHDIALIILAEPVVGIVHEELPRLDYMDEIVQQLPPGKGKQEMDLVFVGYGATGNWELPDLHLDADRRIGSTTFKGLLPLEILTMNSGQDDATICDGDSGGPVFHRAILENEVVEVLVGLHSHDGSSSLSCAELGVTFKYRLDTTSAQSFIKDTIENYFPPK